MSTSALSQTFSITLPLQYHTERQIKRLVQAGYPRAMGITSDKFSSQLQNMVYRAAALFDMPLHDYPFLIVIPAQVVPLGKQVPMIEFNGSPAYTFLDLSEVSDRPNKVPAPNKPYLAVDIDNGYHLLHQSPLDSADRLEASNWFPHTAAETIAHLVQWPDVLRSHNLHASGSFLMVDGKPYVVDAYQYAGEAKLKRDKGTAADKNWATAFSKHRISV